MSIQQTGHTALMLAAKEGHLNVVRKLITSGARLDVVDKVNSLSTMGIQCTHLHAQHVTVLCSSCQPTVVLLLSAYSSHY